MLARHLNRLTRPVRYAMPPRMAPELAQALSNYLMIHSRAHDLRGAHEESLPRLGLQGNPRLHRLMEGILGGHHEAPAMYADVLHEAHPGLHPPEGMHLHGEDRLDDLLHLVHSMAGNVQRPFGSHPVGRIYSQRNLEHPHTRDLLLDGWAGGLWGQEWQPGEAARNLRTSSPTGGVPDDLRGYLNAAYHGIPYVQHGGRHRMDSDPLAAILAQHDVAHEAARRGEGRGHAGTLVSGIRDLLRAHLIPHLMRMP